MRNDDALERIDSLEYKMAAVLELMDELIEWIFEVAHEIETRGSGTHCYCGLVSSDLS